ncbi:MAG: hypothetical protein ACTSRP_08780 [Candidatus Helarchaeota archaeon]
MLELYRQGDLLFKRIKIIPKKAKEKDDNIILEGELTGHAHCILSGTVLTLDNNIYVKAEKNARVIHNEHRTIELPEGFYKVIRQREYIDRVRRGNPLKGEYDLNVDGRISFYRFVRD